MKEIIQDAVNFLKENKVVLLTTIIEDNHIDTRMVGPFLNDDLIVYIFTLRNSNKVKQILKNAHVSLYVQNNFENIREFRSLLINGNAFEILSEDERIKMKNALELKSKGYKEWIDKDGWDTWSIIKIQPISIKFVDNSKWKEPQIIKIGNE